MHATIVTGCSRGLGEALADTLLGHGFDVTGVGRSAGAGLVGPRFRLVACDLEQPAGIAAAVEPALRAVAASRPQSVTLINNAAVAWPVGVVGRLGDGECERALATNVVAPLVLANAFLRVFADAPMPRRIINISSGAAQSAIAGSAVYSMSKAAIEMLSKSIAADYPAAGVTSIALRPGIFETGMQQFMRGHDPLDFPSVELFRGFKENGLLKSPAEVAERIVARLVEGAVEQGRTYTHVDL
jgi:NAD(P)-dependent dehydrogenase (short-subunit alcohol dehydrogenase family)